MTMRSANEFSYWRQETYFIDRLPCDLRYAGVSQYYKGLKVVHNLPLTAPTIYKIESLRQLGVDITVTCPTTTMPDAKVLSWLYKRGVTTRLSHRRLADDVDIVMDSGGELINYLTPRIGSIEVTGSGAGRYRNTALNYPVMSIDDSAVKQLESCLGAGEAFIRAFSQLVGQSIQTDQLFVIFGFGKVGQGIVRALSALTPHIVIVDDNPDVVANYKHLPYTLLHTCEVEKIEQAAASAHAVVTATGQENILSGRYDLRAFRQAHLANMGASDEFGSDFDKNQVLAGKQPINMALDEPTKLRYLDPVFYAQNHAISLLMNQQYSPGVHAYPENIATTVVDEWQTVYGEKLTTFKPGQPH